MSSGVTRRSSRGRSRGRRRRLGVERRAARRAACAISRDVLRRRRRASAARRRCCRTRASRCVDRGRCRSTCGRTSPRPTAFDVARRRVGQWKRRREVVRRVRVHPLLDRGRQDEGLERRARLPPRLGARLNWLLLRPGMTAVIARIAPFAGLIETTAAAGSSGSYSVSLDRLASRRAGSAGRSSCRPAARRERTRRSPVLAHAARSRT